MSNARTAPARTALLISGLTLLSLAHAAGQNVVFPKMDHLKDNETLQSAKLDANAIKQISQAIEATAFDTPDSWESELRVRRVSLGESSGLVLQGTKLLCGATGNCQTWVLRRADDHWLSLFKNQAPIASGFGFDEKTTNGIKRFVVAANSSAADSKYVVYDFDGKFYRESACYSRHGEADGKTADREGTLQVIRWTSDLNSLAHLLSVVGFTAGVVVPAALFAHFASVLRNG